MPELFCISEPAPAQGTGFKECHNEKDGQANSCDAPGKDCETMKAEILAPAGNRDAFEAALAAGADAVYFGLPLFGARAFAKNFSLEEAREIIEKAHLYGMKAYITMNTLLEEDQMEQAADYARRLQEMGADALIIQDLGLIHLLHHTLPDLELHASTQLSVNAPEQIEVLKKMGVKRVVLARECTLEEIKACKKAGLELEVFVHGALCISYSGQCQFSRVRYGRSGNKGACAQPCRMEYTLLEDGRPVPVQGRYLLSPRDLSVLQDIPALEKAGVDSLKIEGRMKSPVYVYESVLKARKAREGKKLNQEDLRELKSAFNRGYTSGHLHGASGLDLMNPAAGNHQGVPAGEVIRTAPGRVTISLSAPLHQNDGIRFVSQKGESGCHVNFLYDSKGRLIREAEAGDVVSVKTDARTTKGARVQKTIDSQLEKEVQQEMDHLKRKVPVTFRVRALRPQEPLELILEDGEHTVSVVSEPLQEAKSRPSDAAYFEKQLKKTGDTFVRVEKVVCELDQPVFIGMPQLNALKREAIEQLAKERTWVQPVSVKPYEVHLSAVNPPKSFAEIHLKDQAVPLQSSSLLLYSEAGFPGTAPIALLAGQKRKKTEPEISAESPEEKQPSLVTHFSPGELVRGLNITNSYALAALLEAGYQGAVLSEEMSAENRRALLENFRARYGFAAPVVQTVYEKPRLMIMNHCPVNTALADGSRTHCARCHLKRYELQGKDGRKVWLKGNPACQMELFDETADNKIGLLPDYAAEGIQAFRLVFTDESPKRTEEILQEYTAALQHRQSAE